MGNPVPVPIQAVLWVEWPAGQVLVTEEDGDEYEVTSPHLVGGAPVAEDRAFFVIAFEEAAQVLLGHRP